MEFDTSELVYCKWHQDCYRKNKENSNICLTSRDIVKYSKMPICFIPVHKALEAKLGKL